MNYTPIQTKWLKHHYAKWRTAYGWSPRQFAQQTKQDPEALALALGIPLQDFGPPPQVTAAISDEPMALPDPEHASVIIEPGVELMPRERPAALSPQPQHTPSVMLSVGWHVIDGEDIDVRPDPASPRARLVPVPLAPGRHLIDGRVAIVPHPMGFHVV